ncbi:MAG: tyrosine-type recombinase/integrase [Phycisphaerae bacterium]
MASVSNHNGRRLIQFTDGQGIRRTVRLGQCSNKDAASICGHIEALAAAKTSGQPVAAQTAAWLQSISDTPHGRLAKAGLCEPRKVAASATIGDFIDRFIAERPDAKPFTVINIRQSKRMLLEYFGENKTMQSVTRDDAFAMQRALKAKGLAQATYGRHFGRCRQFWRAATKQEIFTGANPFADIPALVKADKARQMSISREIVDKCIAAAPDNQWRLIIALARYGGLRTPSETLALKWDCINWEYNRIRVPSPKTEHHKGGDCRVIPLFPELKQRLLDVFDEAEPGVPWVITRYRQASVNLRTTFLKIIHRAGEKPWPKLFHNLRASRQNELAESYPLHVACQWIGNNEPVAQEYYLTVNDAHFAKAVAEPCSALQNALQFSAANTRNEPQGENADMQKPLILQGFASICESTQDGGMPGMGVEPTHPLRSTGF